MICAACGTENPSSKRFCRGYGAPLAAACPSCGGGVLPDDRFCGECGTPLAGPPAAVAAPVTEPFTERRLVTVLFAGAWQQTVKLAFPVAIEAALAVGRIDRVESLLAMVELQPSGLQTPLVAAHAHRFRGRMSDSPDAAEAAFSAAERILRERSIPFWLAVVQLEHAEARLAHSATGDVHALLAEARPTFERLAARPWLDRLAAVEGGTLHTAVPDVAG